MLEPAVLQGKPTQLRDAGVLVSFGKASLHEGFQRR